MDTDTFDTICFYSGALLLVTAFIGVLRSRELATEIARLGIGRLAVVLFSAVWFVFSPVVPLLGFAISLVVMSCSPVGDESAQPSL